MQQRVKKVAALLLASAMSCGAFATTALAEGTAKVSEDGKVTVDKTAAPLVDDKTTVKLTADATTSMESSDVIFLLNKVTLCDPAQITAWANTALDSLIKNTDETGAPVNVAVAVFSAYGYECLPLTELNTDTVASIRSAFAKYTFGSNMVDGGIQSGIEFAESFLNKDDGTSPKNKHVVLINPECNYIWSVDEDAYSNPVAHDATDGMYKNVKGDVLYSVATGNVTDIIGEDFDLTDLSSMTMTLGDTVIGGIVDGDRVTFPTANNAEAYVVEYTADSEGVSEQFVWTINAPVCEEAPIALSYDLTLVNKETEAGTYTVPTNMSAVLSYVGSKGETGTVEYPVPTVEYTVEAVVVPTAEPTAEPTATPEPSTQPTATPDVTPVPSIEPTVTPNVTMAPTATPTATVVPVVTPTAVPSNAPAAADKADNTPSATAAPATSRIPQTSDATPVMLLVVLAALSAAGFAGVMVWRKHNAG